MPEYFCRKMKTFSRDLNEDLHRRFRPAEKDGNPTIPSHPIVATSMEFPESPREIIEATPSIGNTTSFTVSPRGLKDLPDFEWS